MAEHMARHNLESYPMDIDIEFRGLYMYVCVYVCMYVCMYVCILTHQFMNGHIIIEIMGVNLYHVVSKVIIRE